MTLNDAGNDAAISHNAIGSTPLSDHAEEGSPEEGSLEEGNEATASGESFLRFYLLSDLSILLSVYQLAEILTLSLGQIVPMFEMPPWVMGVYNWRGEVLWIIDLNHFLGLTPWYQQPDYNSKHTVVVLKSYLQTNSSTATKEAVLGLVVNRVEDMVFCDPESIQPPSDPLLFDRVAAMPEIQPFLRGYWQNFAGKSAEESIGELNLVLEGAAIMRAMPTSDYKAVF